MRSQRELTALRERYEALKGKLAELTPDELKEVYGGSVRVYLLQDVPGKGNKGDVITVSEGYATHYLFPKKLAVEAAQ